MTLIAENKKNFKKPIFPSNIIVNKTRYIVESQNSWLKSYRKIILRYDKYITNFESFLLLAFSMITNNKMKKNGHMEIFINKSK